MIMKSSFMPLVALSSAISAWAHGEEEAKEMGPVAFMWPPDRVWGAAYDNTAPCGSSSGATNRTDFPMADERVCSKSTANSHSSSKMNRGTFRSRSLTKAVCQTSHISGI
ncbi:unnamed protein product [Aspergillus oryzae RIB40]|uniref:DNA, SC111 n=2 Tax=Aspergillus oryzae TaxID=5062 RepID=Q2U8U0_ASPOR|nr:unnamed protein product [Aspergillus oryzae RIB40]EIT80425.1 hypothetical protein Ao3042_02895 [Aspergillus oryzae 3.042]KDE80618.1 hypothetical protein AO1008_07256 [Aspergillus oryzae 100-8]BAE62025.1 unnamed protein product [Aspergillus oryzae RIB40]|eukprot:EIT80425.1 hypothetical protein Ao3042_02895 [Aspergillus oryzae 3.042]